MRFVTIFVIGISLTSPFFIEARTLGKGVRFAHIQNVTFQDRNSITGFVFGESRTPVARIYVELQNDFYSTIGRIRTNGSGHYTFTGLPPGNYNVRVITSGTDYEEQTLSVSLVPISAIPGRGAVSEQIDFHLKVKKKRSDGPLASPGVLFVQEIPDEAKKLYESGIDDLKNKKEPEAFDKLKRSIEIFPDYFLALERLGTEYVTRGHFLAASILLNKAIAVNPRSFSSVFWLGLAEVRLQNIDKAIGHLENAKRIDKDSVNAHLWLGIALHAKNRYSDALVSLLEANKLSNGESPEVHWQLARVYKDTKRFREAADELELFLKHSPEAANAEEIKQVIKTLRQSK